MVSSSGFLFYFCSKTLCSLSAFEPSWQSKLDVIFEVMNYTSKIAVTVITGFLGAGKTTFINSVLKKYPDTKFALVENEFGEVSVDSKLIKGVNASQMFELKNGCICCTITDEYEQALKELATLFPHIEHLLVETSGIADPAPVIRPFFSDKDLKRLYRFNGTVCLIDAKYFQRYPAKMVAFRQLAVADSVIITKSEEISQTQKEKFNEELIKLNPLADYLFSDFGHVPDFNPHEIQHKVKLTPDFDDEYKKHEYLQVKTMRIQKPINKLQFTEWLSYTLDIHKNEIYRVKGILCFENEPFEFILQGVGGSFEIYESENFLVENKGEMVFIGNLKRIELKFSF
jgi:G3E family GTPase